MGFRGMRDKTFFVYGIRDWLQNFAGYEIQIDQMSLAMRDRTKEQLQDTGNSLIFSQDTGFIHPHRGPLSSFLVNCIYLFLYYWTYFYYTKNLYDDYVKSEIYS